MRNNASIFVTFTAGVILDGLWGRSYWRADYFEYHHRGGWAHYALINRGTFSVGRRSGGNPFTAGFTHDGTEAFDFDDAAETGGADLRKLEVPLVGRARNSDAGYNFARA